MGVSDVQKERMSDMSVWVRPKIPLETLKECVFAATAVNKGTKEPVTKGASCPLLKALTGARRHLIPEQIMHYCGCRRHL